MLGEVWVTIVIILQCADTFKSNNLKERRRRKREERKQRTSNGYGISRKIVVITLVVD